MAEDKQLQQGDPQQPVNPTTYSDKPIQGTQERIVINDLQVRQAIRTILGIQDWRTALIAADSRYWPSRTRLYDIYTDILLDGHLTGIIQKRVDSVLNKPIFYMTPDGNRVDKMNQFCRSWQFRTVMKHIIDTQLWGVTGLEFIPGKDFRVRLIPRKHIKTKTQTISIEQTGFGGIDYTTLSNIWVIGEAEDLGLLVKCAPYVIYKRGLMGDWAQYIEVFGMPIRTMYYDANDQQSKIELKQVLDESGSALALMIPKGVEFKLEDGKTSNGDGKLQDTFTRVLNSEMSVVILGNTETTGSGSESGGSLAKSKTHQEQQDEITKNDIAYLEAMLSSQHFHNILASYGFPVVEGGYFEFNKDIDIDFLSKRAEIDTKLLEAGVQITQEYFWETYNLPKPEAKETIVGQEEGEMEEDPEKKPKPGSKKEVPEEEEPEEQPAKKGKRSAPDLADNSRLSFKQQFRNAMRSMFGPSGFFD